MLLCCFFVVLKYLFFLVAITGQRTRGGIWILKVERPGVNLRSRALIHNHLITVWVKNPPPGTAVFWHFFHKRLGIFNQLFTHILYVPIYARLQIFIQLSSILTKLCQQALQNGTNGSFDCASEWQWYSWTRDWSTYCIGEEICMNVFVYPRWQPQTFIYETCWRRERMNINWTLRRNFLLRWANCKNVNRAEGKRAGLKEMGGVGEGVRACMTNTATYQQYCSSLCHIICELWDVVTGQNADMPTITLELSLKMQTNICCVILGTVYLRIQYVACPPGGVSR